MERNKNWHSYTNAELEREFRSDSATGLTEAEAHRRLRHGKNKIWEVKTVSVKKYLASSMLDFTTVLLILTVVAAAFFGRGNEALAVAVMLVLCRAVRVAVYIYSQRNLEKNASAALPLAKVVRGGSVRQIPADRIVTGDVIILDSGDTVPCDIRLTAADNVIVSETYVTDKEGLVKKDSSPVVSGKNKDIPLSLRTNMLYATSVVVGGFGIGMAVATGKDTLVCAREGSVEIPGGEDIPVLDKLSDWSRVCSLALVAAAFIITILGITVGSQSFFGIFLPSVAMSSACLSEFIGAVGAFSWSVSLRKDKKEGGVYKNVSTAEAAANADVLIVRSSEIFKSRKITLHSYFTDSKLKLIGTKGAEPPSELLALACYCTGMTPKGSIAKGSFGQGVRQTSIIPYDVVRSMWDEHGDKSKDPGYTILGHVTAGEEGSDGFDGTLLALENRFIFAMSGRAERIVDRCASYKEGGKIYPLDAEYRKKVLSYAAALKKHGVTVCAVAQRESPYNSMRRLSVLQNSLCFEGFIAVSDRMEEGAAAALSKFRGEGGRVMIFSDPSCADHDEDKLFCESEGVFRTGDLYLDEKESKGAGNIPLDEGTLTMIRTPGGAEGIRERLRFIGMCRAAGLRTAYVGYGVEDMWSMQRSDVSVAVPGPQGTVIPQVLRTAADGVSDTVAGGFSAAFGMIEKCRRAMFNLRNILTYLITSHSARLILMLICAVASFPVMNATHLVFWGLVLDFVTVMAIAKTPSSGGYLKASECAMPEEKSDVLYPTLFGVLCAVLSTATPFVGRAVISASGREFALSEQQMVVVMFTSCILAMPFVAAEFAGRWGLFSRESEYGKAFILPFAAAAAGIVAALASPISEIPFPGFLMCAFMLIPAVVIVAVMSVIRAAQTKQENKQ